jgi:hypothetical protein
MSMSSLRSMEFSSIDDSGNQESGFATDHLWQIAKRSFWVIHAHKMSSRQMAR